MAKKQRKFADDGWAIWVDGDDTSTVYLNDWLNPKGKSYVDLAVRIRGVQSVKSLQVYVPFSVTREEVEDVSLLFKDTKILQATFSAACIVDYMKNPYTSEIAYNGKTVDIVHISTLAYQAKRLSEGTLISIDLEQMWPFWTMTRPILFGGCPTSPWMRSSSPGRMWATPWSGCGI